MEEVVAQHECSRSPSQKVSANQKRLGQTIRTRLDRVLNVHAPGRPIAKQALKSPLIVGCGDDQHLPNPRQHQCAERVIDHRLVVHRQELFAHRLGDRMQTGAAATRQDDALALLGHQIGLSWEMLARSDAAAR